jgi:hypothetical protein
MARLVLAWAAALALVAWALGSCSASVLLDLNALLLDRLNLTASHQQPSASNASVSAADATLAALWATIAAAQTFPGPPRSAAPTLQATTAGLLAAVQSIATPSNDLVDALQRAQQLLNQLPADESSFPAIRRALVAALALRRHTEGPLSAPLSAQATALLAQLYQLHQASARRKRVVEFAHVSKSGGTSFCQLAELNGCDTESFAANKNCEVAVFRDQVGTPSLRVSCWGLRYRASSQRSGSASDRVLHTARSLVPCPDARRAHPAASLPQPRYVNGTQHLALRRGVRTECDRPNKPISLRKETSCEQRRRHLLHKGYTIYANGEQRRGKEPSSPARIGLAAPAAAAATAAEECVRGSRRALRPCRRPHPTRYPYPPTPYPLLLLGLFQSTRRSAGGRTRCCRTRAPTC